MILARVIVGGVLYVVGVSLLCRAFFGGPPSPSPPEWMER